MVDAPFDLLCLGLELVGFKTRRIKRTRYKKNLSRFCSAFGVGPETVRDLLNDIAQHGIKDEPDAVWLLIALNWMRVYNTEEFMEGVFDSDEKTIREHVWDYILAIRQLKDVKIKWLWDDRHANDGGPVFIISVDGVHCPINEPRKKPNAKWYSHKFHKPGLAYEIAISVYSSKVVWVRGPFPAGTSDLSIFKRTGKGLKHKMPPGTKAIADRAYTSESLCATRNDEFDDGRVRKFKRRVRARHENINARIKVYNALTIPFRHGVQKHGAVFDVACILVQYNMENGHPLFEV